jgi:hypothetical protein
LDGKFRDKLMRVRIEGQDCDREGLTAEVEQLYKRVEAKMVGSSLPATIDTKPLTSWILGIRKAQIYGLRDRTSSELPAPPQPSHPLFSDWQNAIRLLKEKGFPETTKIHLCGITGGCSIGLSGAPDVIVLYQAPSEFSIDLFSSHQTILSTHDSAPKFFSGLVLIEIEEAFRLLIRGHHQLMSLLSSKTCWCSPEMENLLSQLDSQSLYHAGCVMHCLGVAEGLISKLLSEPEKRLYLSRRLAWQARRMLERQALGPLSDEDIRTLREMKAMNLEKSAAEDLAQAIRQDLHELKLVAKKTDLSEKLSSTVVKVLNDWLLQRRRDGFLEPNQSST